jgi:hypothetical protein
MSTLQLNAIATRAMLDNEFRVEVLNGKRKQRLSEFDLTKDEFDAVMAIDANDLDQFIVNLRKLMHSSQLLVWAGEPITDQVVS